MNVIVPVQGCGGSVSLRSVLIAAGMWNVARLSEQSGVEPHEVMSVLFNQVVSSHVVYRLMCVVNTIGEDKQWMID
jgi:hypothetical protein